VDKKQFKEKSLGWKNPWGNGAPGLGCFYALA